MDVVVVVIVMGVVVVVVMVALGMVSNHDSFTRSSL